MSTCRICLKKTSDLSSIFDRAERKYLPKIVYSISGVKIDRRSEPNASICVRCKQAVLNAERTILRCQESEQLKQKASLDGSDTETDTDWIDTCRKRDNLLCDHCEFSTQTARTLVAHLKASHQIDDPNIFPCKNCEKRFPWKSALYRHMENDHNTLPPEKKFLCIDCSNIYISQKHLIEHQLQTHGPRRFRCVEPDCKQTFTRAFTLRRHFLSTHQNKTRRYHCSDCNQYFKVYDHWKYHNKIVHQNQKRDFQDYKSSKNRESKNQK